jgi:DNA repair exonuclease SbcCD ATPase subunit
MDVSQSLPLLLDSDDAQALKHKLLELQRDNSSLRVANAKLGRRMTVALASAALSEKHALMPAVDEPDASFSAEDALLAHHQSEIAAAESAVTIASLKREIRDLRSKNSELQQQADSVGSSVSDVQAALHDATLRLTEYQSLYVESDRRNQEFLEQISEEQNRYRQLEGVMVSIVSLARPRARVSFHQQVGLQRDIAESRDRNHALEELVRQLRAALDKATAEYHRSLQTPSYVVMCIIEIQTIQPYPAPTSHLPLPIPRNELQAALAQVDSLTQQISTIQTELLSLRSSMSPSSAALSTDISATAQLAALRDYLARLEEGAAQRERAVQKLESELETTKRRLMEQERKAEAMTSQHEEEQRDYEYQMNSMRRRLAAAVSSRTPSAAPHSSLQSNRLGHTNAAGSAAAADKRASSARSSPKKKPKARSKSASASAHVSASDGDSDDAERIDAVAELREARRRLRAIKFDRDLVKDERDVLQSKLYAAEQEILAAVSKSKQSHKDLVETRSSVKAVELRLQGMEEQLKVAKSVAADAEEVRAAAASFESALKAARDDAARKSRLFRELAAEKKVVDEQCADVQQQCKGLKERVKQLQSHNARLQERIVTLSAEAEAAAQANAALAIKQAAIAKPATAPPIRSPLDAHVASNVTASAGTKPRSKSPHTVAPAASAAAAAEPKPKPSESDAKKDAIVRSLQVWHICVVVVNARSCAVQIAAQQQEALVATLREVTPFALTKQRTHTLSPHPFFSRAGA